MLHVDADKAAPSPMPAQVFITFARAAKSVGEDDDGKWTAAFGMGDEGGGLAILGRNIDLLVDHGRFFSCFLIPIFCRVVNTIARKPDHDKAMGRLGAIPALNRAPRIAIVLQYRPNRSERGDFSR